MLINFPIICQEYQTQMFYSKMEFKHYLSNKLTMWLKIKQGKFWYMCLHWAVSIRNISLFTARKETQHRSALLWFNIWRQTQKSETYPNIRPEWAQQQPVLIRSDDAQRVSGSPELQGSGCKFMISEKLLIFS